MRYVANPPNPWLTQSVEWIGKPPPAKIEVFEETETRSIISHNDSPDVAFDYSINCYRGCIHACTYCFSRPTHEYLDFGAGTDFERKIVVKLKAAELLRKELMKSSWKGDEIVFSFTSDPYIPLEANYKLTRACLEVCAEFRNPVGIITKSALIRRDIDVLQKLSTEASVNTGTRQKNSSMCTLSGLASMSIVSAVTPTRARQPFGVPARKAHCLAKFFIRLHCSVQSRPLLLCAKTHWKTNCVESYLRL